MNDQEIISAFFASRPEFAVQANASFLIERAGTPLTVQSLAAAAQALRDTLLLAPAYESAWQNHVFYNPDQKGLAHRGIFIENLREKEIQAAATKEHEALVKQLGEKFRGESLDRLRAVAEKRRVHGQTASEFRAERAASAPTRQRSSYDGYPVLPEFLVLPGDVQARKIDAEFLNRIYRTDYYIYRRLYDRFGGRQLTDRQNISK